MNKYKIFNPINFNISGVSLIEASAGTGKTYSLIILYLRLILGLNKINNIYKKISVKKILIVTYTNNSVLDIKIRIKNIINDFIKLCITGKSNNKEILLLLKYIKCKNTAKQYLLKAKKELFLAPILTIHSFCKKILKKYFIELKIPFNVSILKNNKILLNQIICDFWRKYFYKLPINITNIILEKWKSPQSLLIDIYPFLEYNFNDKKYKYNNLYKFIIKNYKNIITSINYIKKKWNKIFPIINVLFKNNINLRIYNKKNLSLWIKKIKAWCSKPTKNFYLPKEQERFKISILKKNIINKLIIKNSIFYEIEKIYQKILSFYEFIFKYSLQEIKIKLNTEKEKNLKLNFNDLINILYDNLKKQNIYNLSKKIKNDYPIAIIDEFQDTNYQQYNIFKSIYFNNLNCALILIGDPKQSIYSFRGSNIFTYINAKKEIKNIYILNKNYRSSKNMINAVNTLFKFNKNAFNNKQILFKPIKYSKYNTNIKFIINNKKQPGINIYLYNKYNININNYKKNIAKYFAFKIYNWILSSYKKIIFFITKNNNKKILNINDITILVNNKYEFELMNNELLKYNINSIYLSNYNNVFTTNEASELLLILKAILYTNKINNIRIALSTNLIGLDANYINLFNNNLKIYEKKIKEFNDYKYEWNKTDIFSMIKKFLINNNITKRLLKNGKHQKLINLLHIGEILYKISQKINSKCTLIRWFEKQIINPNLKKKKYQIRINYDKKSIKIITIHKSKGLEFPIVFVPFISNLNIFKKNIFYNEKNNNINYYLNIPKNKKKIIYNKNLSEELRLLYVALTRSIYHCSIGIYPIIKKKHLNTENANIELSSIGYLIQKGIKGNIKYLKQKINNLIKNSNNDINLYEIKSINIKYPKKIINLNNINCINNNILVFNKNKFFNITSYSELFKQNKEKKIFLNKNINIINNKKLNIIKKKKIILSPHSFMKGSYYGIFLHKILEKINFQKNINVLWLKTQLNKYDINLKWINIINLWIKQIINISLNKQNLSLSLLNKDTYFTELKFFISIKNKINDNNFNTLCKYSDILSSQCKNIHFNNFKGIIKGFIDLIFKWNNKYYLLDYKSNWLGNDYNSYSKNNIIKHMILNRYDLQYQIYTIALHKFLKHRLINYKYQKHFGGIFYMFIRGINNNYPNNGIYYIRPKDLFIYKMNKLFT